MLLNNLRILNVVKFEIILNKSVCSAVRHVVLIIGMVHMSHMFPRIARGGQRKVQCMAYWDDRVQAVLTSCRGVG